MGTPNTFDHHQTDTSAALDAGQCLVIAEQKIQTAEEGGMPFILKRDGAIVKLEELLLKPIRHKAKPTFKDAVSFLQYLAIYKTGSSVIFADISGDGGSFKAMIDMAAPNDRSWHDHTATFTLETTEDWDKWIESNDKWLNQEDFCLFVERHTQNFFKPTGADFLEISHSIEATVGGQYKSGVRLQSGDRTLLVDMSTVASAKVGEMTVEVPEQFSIVLAPFEGQNPQQMDCFLRFRCTSNGVLFKYEMQQVAKAVETSALEARSRIEQESTLPVFNGSFQ